jgi:ornithine cyclodeaminase/alanine dehydrogenase-like protein (mu-crystallin family)
LNETQVHEVFRDKSPAEIAAETTECIARANLEQGSRDVGLHKRVHVDYPMDRGYRDGSGLRILPGIAPGVGGAGFRCYAMHHGGGRVLDPNRERAGLDYTLCSEMIVLYDYRNDMKLLALMSGSFINILRTAAATGLSARLLSRKDSKILGFFGAGRHAYYHIRCVLNERPGIEEIRICSRTPERRDELVRRLQAEVAQTVTAVDSRQAVEGADIVVTCTSAGKPVFNGEWVAPGVHVTQVARDEVDANAARRAKIFVSWKPQILHDTPIMGPYGGMVASGELSEDDVTDLADVLAGKAPGRTNDQEITLFASQGVGIWDVAIGKYIHSLAVQKGIGTEFEFHEGAHGYTK